MMQTSRRFGAALAVLAIASAASGAQAVPVRLTDLSDACEELSNKVNPAVVRIFASGYALVLGFAAPSNIVRTVYEQIRSTGRVRRGEIGVRAQTITPSLARGLDLPQDRGVILADVYPSGPAAEAGLEQGDIVLSLDGKAMENGRQLHVNVYRHRVDDRIELTVLRGGKTLRFTVTVQEERTDPDRFADLVHPDRNLIPDLGILGMDLDDQTSKLFPGLRKLRGVVVAARSADAASLAGDELLLPGDVIYSINRSPIRSLAELKAAVAGLRQGDPMVLVIERESLLHYVTLEMR